MNERRTFRCPSCSVVLPAGPEAPPSCPRCRLVLRGPVAAALEAVDLELTTLGRRTAELVARRVALLAQLRPTPVGAPAAGGGLPSGAAPATAGVPVQTTLLTLGALLLSVAGTIFTVLAWGHLGIGGRASVLVLGTGVAAAAAGLLLRRGLRASGDALAVLALVLGALDLHAVRLLAAPEAGPVGWWAAATAVLAAVGAAAGGRLRLPALLGVAAGLTQLPLPLAALAALSDRGGEDLRGALAVLAVALAATAGADVALRSASADADWAGPARRILRGAAVACLVVAGLLACGAALVVDTSGAAVPGAAALLVVTAGWMLLGLQSRSGAAAAGAAGAAAVSGLLAATAVVLPAALRLHGSAPRAASLETGLLVPTALATLLLLAVPLLPVRVRTGPRVVGCGVVGLALLPAMGRVLEAGGAVAAQLGRPWPALLPASTTDVLRTAGVAAPHAALVGLLAVAALAAVLAGRGLDTDALRASRAVGAGLAAAAALLLPTAVALPLPVAVVAALGPAVALVAPLLIGRTDVSGRCVSLLALAAPFAAAAVAWAAAERSLTLVALGVLAALAASVTWRVGEGRDPLAPVAPVAPVTAVVASLLGLALVPVAALAVGAAAGPAGALLATAGAVALLAVDRPEPSPVRAGALWATAAMIGLGTALTALDADLLSLVLGGLAVATLALTLRPGRAPAAVLSAGLATAALWMRLADAGVTLPEAYTLPPALLALAVGETVRRRGTELDPSLLLTPGLILGLVPTLLISLAEPDPTRAALLTVGATTVVVAGAWSRLRAPLVGGALVVGAVALRQLAPLAAVTPRWVLLGVLGLVLLVLGVRYERARADLGRLRRSFARLG